MKIRLIIIFLFVVPLLLEAQQNLDSLFLRGHQKGWSKAMTESYKTWEKSYFRKPAEGSLRQRAIMNGNKILTEIWNYGSISSPGNSITDIIWEGLGYGYEFGPFVGAEVPVPQGSHPDVKRRIVGTDTTWYVEVISDGLKSLGGEFVGNVRSGWQPLITSYDGTNQYLTLESEYIPTSDDRDRDGDGKPDSWPDGWYNSNLREYVWPGALGQGATNADKESFFVMDDRQNIEFAYFPYPSDSSRKGLGLEVEARYYQWSNVEAEDAIFLIYKVQNKGFYNLRPVIFGMWGDPHIGGPLGNEYDDDWASFDTKLEMTFAWDNDHYSNYQPDITPGYLGYKFLESPGVSTDGIDNDEDGMIDESWTDGIDNDGDWNVDNDDVGIDGVPNTGDQGENDGLPTAGDPFDLAKPGEPNFEFTDIDESDMIGLTSFAQPVFTSTNKISNDRKVWEEFINPGVFDTTEVQGDYIFVYGSGKFELKSIYNVSSSEVSDAIKRFSIALIVAQDKNDLILNANTVQKIYNSGYQFAKPPAKPRLSVVPGDRKVTLFWDNLAESSKDPISKEFDFEGYIIFRSTDPGFLDQQTITDMYGNRFLFEPLKTSTGANAQFDLENDKFGPSNIPYSARGVSFFLGDDTGLRWSFVDSNNVINGQTYYYAVVSYDHGSDSLNIPPSVCSKIISYDPTTNEYSFDVNTAQVIPRRRAAGYINGQIKNYDDNFGVERLIGHSTGTFQLTVLDDRKIEDNNEFYIRFTASDTADTYYSVEDAKYKEETFISFYSNEVNLHNININDTTVIVSDVDDESITYIAGVDYEINGGAGSIIVLSGGNMSDATEYKIKYTNFPIYKSTNLDGELSNPVFDGIRLAVREDSFAVNRELTGWSVSSQTGLKFNIIRESAYAEDPYDYEIEFFDQIVDTTITNVRIPFTIKDVINNQYMEAATSVFNKDWEPGDTFFILRGGLTYTDIVWQIQSSYPDSNNTNAPGVGDVFYMETHKKYADGELFYFETNAPNISKEKAKSVLDLISVVPNPYVATNAIEPSNKVSTAERGYRRLYFDHLPQECTIRIYTQAGELVKVLEHNSTMDDGKEFWNLLTRDNMEVAYGLYFFHVDAPGVGEKIGKFVIIK